MQCVSGVIFSGTRTGARTLDLCHVRTYENIVLTCMDTRSINIFWSDVWSGLDFNYLAALSCVFFLREYSSTRR